MKVHNLMLSLAVLSMGCHGFAADKIDKKLSGEVKIDGSSTVYPVAEAAAEEFQKVYPNARVSVGMSGTGGGMKKFTVGEIDIANSSRKIKPEEEAKAKFKVNPKEPKDNGKVDGVGEYIELPLAYDGISVVVHPTNKWAKKLTFAQLKEIWKPGSKVKTWKDIDPSWPNDAIKLYGPGADSGTFDFFTEQVMGTARLSRNDYTASEDDNVLVTAVSKEKNALAYFGFAYYEENQKAMNVVALAKDKDAVVPSPQSIEDGSYPLSRPLLVYVSLKAAQRPEVKTFVTFLLQNAGKLSKEVGYVPLKEAVYADALKKFESFAASPAKQTH